ncbi:large conductance mechanosensitive channel protein MscL [Oribacterium sp. WCC10]|uniref:large conductance mechanosensitive channel protein MscL n=1 Tax=Oribacterium sp. WCC10 TaxID=1855343 RepID=UPI0008EAD567|nr:large conductance mechanosensitive channel protein MscL [Oribacterium sp. WCC10]SFG48231.1 large conductance mechanosensitive channel [Oribacterium sp. WCC10]
MKGFLKEFKEFAVKGNMIDLAVGMIIGSAFTALVKSVVDDLVMPVLSIFTGKLDFNNMFIPLADQTTKVYSEAVEQGAVFAYGKFLTEALSFLIMAFVVFMFVKAMNKLRKQQAEAPAPATTKECPYCKSEIKIEATRCPNCTSKLEGFKIDPAELNA